MGLFDFLKKTDEDYELDNVYDSEDYNEDNEEDIENECVILEDIDDVLLENGEFNYDNYDEVCCPKCGAYLGQGVDKCTECDFGQEEPSVCPSCGKFLEEDDGEIGFCPYCNNPLDRE